VGNFLTSWKPVIFSRRPLLHGYSNLFFHASVAGYKCHDTHLWLCFVYFTSTISKTIKDSCIFLYPKSSKLQCYGVQNKAKSVDPNVTAYSIQPTYNLSQMRTRNWKSIAGMTILQAQESKVQTAAGARLYCPWMPSRNGQSQLYSLLSIYVHSN